MRGRGQAAIDAARGGPHPPAGHPFLQLGLAAVGPGQVLEHGRGRVGAAQHGLRQLEQRGRLFPGPRGLDRAPGGQVHHAADRDRDGHEQQQGQQLPRLLDGEGVQRLGEVPVEQQAGRHRGEHRGPEPAQHRDRHHGHQVDEQVVGEVQVRPEAVSTAVSSGSIAAASSTPASRRRASMAPPSDSGSGAARRRWRRPAP
jgi:hypothetical protein